MRGNESRCEYVGADSLSDFTICHHHQSQHITHNGCTTTILAVYDPIKAFDRDTTLFCGRVTIRYCDKLNLPFQTYSIFPQQDNKMKIAFACSAFLGLASAFAPTSHVARQTTQLAASNGKDDGEKSKALPFVPRPKLLDGTLAGDVGFE